MVKENVLYYKEDIEPSEPLISEFGEVEQGAQEFELSKEEIKKVVQLLQTGNPGLLTKCKSVYKHAILIDDVTFNICISCGEYLQNGKRKGFSKKEELKELLKIIKKL